MISLKTNCEECLYSKVCKYRGNGTKIREILSKSICHEEESNDLYKWSDMCNKYNVRIDISCPEFEKKQTTLLRGKM